MPLRLFTLLAAGCLVACLGPASAQDRSRQADEDACRPDVFRLCASEIPDETGILACLNSKVASLSPQCRAVIAPAPVVRKRRVPRPRPRRRQRIPSFGRVPPRDAARRARWTHGGRAAARG